MVRTFFYKIFAPIFFSLIMRKDDNLITVGGGACPWTFRGEGLNANSRVICAGVGDDISFELELVKKFGCRMVLVDPSPTGINTIQTLQPLPEQIDFLPVGLAVTSEVYSFSDPANLNDVSFKRRVDTDKGGEHKWECRSLLDLARQKGWSSLDLVKMDIEGFEYDVLSNLPLKELPISQILVELHTGGQHAYRFRDVLKVIFRLRREGYQLVHRYLKDYTFVKILPKT
jgi:FkbM family methyltransferase